MEIHKITRLFMCVVIGILSLIKEGLGITCYQCKSKIHPQCESLGSLSTEDREPYKTKCWQLEGANTKNYTNCRIIRQDIDGEKSMVRQCATGAKKRDLDCTRKTGTRKIKMEYCECSKDLCNTASSKLRISNEALCTMFLVVVTSIRFT